MLYNCQIMQLSKIWGYIALLLLVVFSQGSRNLLPAAIMCRDGNRNNRESHLRIASQKNALLTATSRRLMSENVGMISRLFFLSCGRLINLTDCRCLLAEKGAWNSYVIRFKFMQAVPGRKAWDSGCLQELSIWREESHSDPWGEKTVTCESFHQPLWKKPTIYDYINKQRDCNVLIS